MTSLTQAGPSPVGVEVRFVVGCSWLCALLPIPHLTVLCGGKSESEGENQKTREPDTRLTPCVSRVSSTRRHNAAGRRRRIRHSLLQKAGSPGRTEDAGLICLTASQWAIKTLKMAVKV